MPVTAMLSDWLFTSTVGVYMLAAVLCAVEYLLDRYPINRPVRTLATIGGPARDEPPADGPEVADRPGRLPVRFGRMGVSLIVLGAVLHLMSVVLRGIATGRVPWGNMYEYLSAVGLTAILALLCAMRTHPVRRIAVFVLLPVALLLFLAGNLLYTEAAAVQSALRSYWIVIHVTAAIMASGVFLVSGVASALHLYRVRHAQQPVPGNRLPEPEFLDRLAYRSGVFGFVTITFAIVTGAIWAESAWGRYWGWDPKETAAFVTWVCYAAYLHARATAGWQRRRAAWINLIGLIVVLFNLFFINLVVAGWHSYAGVN